MADMRTAEELKAIDKKIADIEDKQKESNRLSGDLKYSYKIQKIIPDAFEHGSVKKIQWTKVIRRRVLTENKNGHPYHETIFVYAGVLTRGDGSTREIPFATLEPRPDNPSFIQLKKKHLSIR